MIFLFWLHSLCHAQEDVTEDRAKELFFNGQLLYEEGEYDSAILAWERGYELTKLPAFIKNIALAYEADENYVDAIVYLKKYRAFAPFEEQEELKAWLTELESSAEQQLVEQQDAEASMKMTETPEETAPISEGEGQSANPVLPPETPPVTSRQFPVLSTVSTGTFVTLAAVSTMHTHRLHGEIKSNCQLTDGVGYCSNEVQKNDLLNQFERSQTTSLALWGISVAGAGLTAWQATKPIQVQVTQSGLIVGGQF